MVPPSDKEFGVNRRIIFERNYGLLNQTLEKMQSSTASRYFETIENLSSEEIKDCVRKALCSTNKEKESAMT